MSDEVPVIRGTCSHEGCEVDTTGVCVRGESSPLQCSFFSPLQDTPEIKNDMPDDGGRTFRSGIGLGYLDANDLMRSSPTFVIPVIGLPEVGKTCYLMSLYSLCLAGRLLPELRFAESRTLIGFEALIRGLRKWDKNALADRVVPHTSSQLTGREPAFLHLCVQETGEGQRLDLLFSDVPGEWFEALINRPASVTEDKLGFIRRANAIAFLVEGPRLMDLSTRLVELTNVRYLLQRLLENFFKDRGQVPVAVLITKMDDVPQVQHDEVCEMVARECAALLHNWQAFVCAAVPKHPDILAAGTGVKDVLLYLKHQMTNSVQVAEIGFTGSAERTFLALASVTGGRCGG